MARKEVGMVWSWGRNQYGQLGNNSIDNQSSPVSIARYSRYSRISDGNGESYTMAIDSFDGMIWSWGRNNYGQLGNNTTINESSPVSIVRPGSYIAVSASNYHSLALDSSGMIWAWGDNAYGILGNNSTNDESSPVSIARPGSYVAVYAGYNESFAIDSSGMIWAWGRNNNGNLGNDSTNDESSPVSIARPGSYTKVSGGYYYCTALDSSGNIWAWGRNNNGNLGNDSTNDESSPVSIARPGSYTGISAGYYQTLAIDGINGMIWAWGKNDYGQLGNDSTNDESSPVSIARPGSYIGVNADYYVSLGLDSSNMIWAWGRNDYGQLGNDSTNNESSPVSIARPGFYTQIGTGYLTSAALRLIPMNYFSDSTVADGISVTSNLDKDEIVSVIADNVTDTYFDSTNEVDSVEVKYVHEDGRQKKVILHSGPSLTGPANWSALTRDGTWQKTQITVRDSVGASRTLTRDEIGDSEDLTHSDGTMNLNT